VEKDLSCEALWQRWRLDPTKATHVIRFEVIEIYDAGRRQGKPAPK
jgi:hypothetical protein